MNPIAKRLRGTTRFLAALFLLVSGVVGIGALACRMQPEGQSVGGPSFTPGLQATYSPLVYTAGTSGTYTVPAGDYVIGIQAHSTTGGTVTITANTAQITDAAAGPAITIPPNGAWNLNSPPLRQAPDMLADNSVLVFAGTDTYVVIMQRYVYP